jgi:hypothetical protein
MKNAAAKRRIVATFREWALLLLQALAILAVLWILTVLIFCL